MPILIEKQTNFKKQPKKLLLRISKLYYDESSESWECIVDYWEDIETYKHKKLVAWLGEWATQNMELIESDSDIELYLHEHYFSNVEYRPIFQENISVKLNTGNMKRGDLDTKQEVFEWLYTLFANDPGIIAATGFIEHVILDKDKEVANVVEKELKPLYEK